MNSSINDYERENLDLIIDLYVELLEYYNEVIKLDINGEKVNFRYQEIVSKIRLCHLKEQTIYESLDKDRIDLYIDYITLNLDEKYSDKSYINNNVDLCLLRIDNYFYNTVKFKRTNNRIDIKSNIFELESIVGSFIEFNLVGICICELFKDDDVNSIERAYLKIFENYFVEYLLLESNFNFEILSQINYMYYTRKMKIDDTYVSKCLRGFISNFESYISNIDNKEEIIPMITAYLIIFGIVDDIDFLNFMDNVYIPNDNIFKYIEEAFLNCKDSLGDYKKVILKKK